MKSRARFCTLRLRRWKGPTRWRRTRLIWRRRKYCSTMWTLRRTSARCAKCTLSHSWTRLKSSTSKRKPKSSCSQSSRNSIKTAAERSSPPTRYRPRAIPSRWELTQPTECINRWICRMWLQGWKVRRKCTARTARIMIFTTMRDTISTTVVMGTMRVTARASWGRAKRWK